MGMTATVREIERKRWTRMKHRGANNPHLNFGIERDIQRLQYLPIHDRQSSSNDL